MDNKIKNIINEKDKRIKNDLYNKYVKEITPKHNLFFNVFKAFIIGGLICTLGQIIINIFLSFNIELELAKSCNTIILILVSVILTGLDIYPKITKFSGAGGIVPITGFANGISSSAIEFKKEGQVFGIGSKIFTIGGPVILYGIFSTWILGLIYYIVKYVVGII